MRRRRRPRAQRPAVDVDDRRQRRVAGAGRRGDPRLDRRRRARAPATARISRPAKAALPRGADRGPRPERPPLPRPSAAPWRAARRSRARHGHGVRAPTARLIASRSASARRVARGRRRARRARVGSTGTPRHAPAAVRDDRDDRPRDRATPVRAGSSTVQPVRSVSTHWPIGRSRSGASATGGAAAVGRPDDRVGAQVVEERPGRRRRRREPPAVGRERRRVAQPPSARISRGSCARRRPRHRPCRVDRPDRGPRPEVRVRPAVRDERDRPRRRAPRDAGHAASRPSVSCRASARPRARPRRTGAPSGRGSPLVPALVDRRDPPGERRLAVLRLRRRRGTAAGRPPR